MGMEMAKMISRGLVRDGGWGWAVRVIGDAVKGIYEAAFMSGVPSDWHQ